MTEKFSNMWFKERLSPHETHSHRLKNILVKKKTSFQNAVVADSYSFGRCLILDGEMQSAKTDEFIYHESLIHPAFCTHPNPKRVLILGGGEGATLREILKHKSVKKVTMVDIDGEVVEWCKKHMKDWHQGAFKDPRAEVIIADAKEYILNTPEKFDVIISDLPSPIEEGPAYQLYTIEFYNILRDKLARDGIFVLQAGSGSLMQIDLHLKLYCTVKNVFPMVRSFSAHIPSFDVPWAFLLCSKTSKIDPMNLSAEKIDLKIQKSVSLPLDFYDGITHEGLFRIPKNLRKMLGREKSVITIKKPVYLYT